MEHPQKADSEIKGGGEAVQPEGGAQRSLDGVSVAERIRFVIHKLGISQGAFARRLGIDPANMSKHLSGRLPITAGLVNRIVVEIGVSKEWLTTGRDVPFAKRGGEFRPELGGNGGASVPIYDIDVVAGTQELSRMFTEDRIIGHISLPKLKREDVIVRVSGDSMEPVITPGAYISINPFTDGRNIYWGQIYVIVLDDYRLVKYVRKADTEDCVRLVSANPQYDDMVVERSAIRALYLVDAVINYQLRC